jgi:hypothetical protein
LALPERISVKISSEAAGSISITPVVRQELAAAQLVENILRVTGKNAGRVRDVLRQGTVINGASRFRWEPLQVSADDVSGALAGFPDPEPGRAFDAGRCVRARLAGGRAPIELERKAVSRRRLLRRRSFWDAVLEAAAKVTLSYRDYSYGDRADVYSAELTAEAVELLRESAGLLTYSSLAESVRGFRFNRLELWVER